MGATTTFKTEQSASLILEVERVWLYIYVHIYMYKKPRIVLWLGRGLRSCQRALSQEEPGRDKSQKKRGAVPLYTLKLQWKRAALDHKARLVMYNSLFRWRMMLVAVPSSSCLHTLLLRASHCSLWVSAFPHLSSQLIPPLT